MVTGRVSFCFSQFLHLLWTSDSSSSKRGLNSPKDEVGPGWRWCSLHGHPWPVREASHARVPRPERRHDLETPIPRLCNFSFLLIFKIWLWLLHPIVVLLFSASWKHDFIFTRVPTRGVLIVQSWLHCRCLPESCVYIFNLLFWAIYPVSFHLLPHTFHKV